MVKLLPSTIDTLISKAVQVDAILQSEKGVSKPDACRRVGISVYQYNRYITDGKNILEAFRVARAGLHKIELQRLLTAQEHVLESMLLDAMNPITDPETKLKIYQFITERIEGLMDAVHAGEQTDTNFLQGPNLTQVESKFSPSEINITIKQRPQTVIDMTAKGQEPPSGTPPGDPQ